MAFTLYLLEHSPKISQAIVNTAVSNGLETYLFKNFEDILTDVKRHRPDIIIINEKLLPKSYDEFLAINNFNIVVYGDSIDLDRCGMSDKLYLEDKVYQKQRQVDLKIRYYITSIARDNQHYQRQRLIYKP